MDVLDRLDTFIFFKILGASNLFQRWTVVGREKLFFRKMKLNLDEIESGFNIRVSVCDACEFPSAARDVHSRGPVKVLLGFSCWCAYVP